jgi:hypothetical protein
MEGKTENLWAKSFPKKSHENQWVKSVPYILDLRICTQIKSKNTMVLGNMGDSLLKKNGF